METKNEKARLAGDLQTIGSRVCHDLRTPLGGIISAAELLREIVADDDPAATSALTSLFDSVDDLGMTIKHLGMLAKATANPLPKKNVGMEEVVSRVLQRLESRVFKKNAAVSQPAVWPEVAGVADWLEFIWGELVSNALKHGGPQIELGWQRDDDQLCFFVTDNGATVPAGVRAKMFQSFETLHAPGSARGLGLAVTRRLVELQGGRCAHEPTARGNKFCFMLPAQPSRAVVKSDGADFLQARR